MKELMALAAGLPTIFQDRKDVAAGGLESYRLCRRETSLEVRQRFIVGPDDARCSSCGGAALPRRYVSRWGERGASMFSSHQRAATVTRHAQRRSSPRA